MSPGQGETEVNQMRQFILKSHGINWMWYAKASLDETGEFVYIWDEFRVHKFDHPKEAHPVAAGEYNRYVAEIDGETIPVLFA
jgi:hypothetical protein